MILLKSNYNELARNRNSKMKCYINTVSNHINLNSFVKVSSRFHYFKYNTRQICSTIHPTSHIYYKVWVCLFIAQLRQQLNN